MSGVKEGKTINVGDIVSGKARGGKHAGEVEAVVRSQKEASEKGVKNPPKVLIEDQHGTTIPLNQSASIEDKKDIMSVVNPESLVHGKDPK